MRRKTLLAFFLVLLPLFSGAQEIIYEQQDSIEIEEIIKKHSAIRYDDKGDLIIAVANEFIGRKYVAGTLESSKDEPLYISCNRLDCTTFVELVGAISMSIAKEERSFRSVCGNLERLRYRGGVRNGYASRLHYMSWWIADNTAKGILEEVTANSCHKEYELKLDFMSTHPVNYSILEEDPAMQAQIAGLEKPFHGVTVKYIPKELLDGGEESLDIKNGDIIALVTSIKGLDVSHVGFACWKNGRLHLVHASSSKGKVINDTENLFRYQKGKSRQTGIRVIRFK